MRHVAGSSSQSNMANVGGVRSTAIHKSKSEIILTAADQLEHGRRSVAHSGPKHIGAALSSEPKNGSVGEAAMRIIAPMISGRAAAHAGTHDVIRHALSPIRAMTADPAIVPSIGAGTKHSTKNRCRQDWPENLEHDRPPRLEPLSRDLAAVRARTRVISRRSLVAREQDRVHGTGKATTRTVQTVPGGAQPMSSSAAGALAPARQIPV